MARLPQKKSGLQAIRDVWTVAVEERARAERTLDPPAGDAEAWGYPPGLWPGAPAAQLPPDCPVRPLGRQGDDYWFLDAWRQLNKVPRKDMKNDVVLLDLFGGRSDYLHHHWPRWGAPGAKGGEPKVNGLEPRSVAACLIHATAEIGAVEIDSRVRGRGGWLSEGRAGVGFVWHGGDRLYAVRDGQLKSAPPMAIRSVVYPGGAPIIAPAATTQGADKSAAGLFEMLTSWSYSEPLLDPVMLFGWIGCAFAGAALDWRPYVFITGDRGTGKSTLQTLLRAVLDDALVKGSNVTEASLRQFGRRDCLAMMIDEFEPGEEDDRRTAGVIELARIAASGDDILRGGADHEGARFTMRSSFLFSAVNAPPMNATDRSRMALIALRPLDTARGGKEPVVDAEIGRVILRLLMDRWPELKPTLEGWRGTLRQAGFSDRAQMTYGTLLAMAELLLGPDVLAAHGVPVENADALGAMFAAYTEEQRAAQTDNWLECVQRIYSAPIDAWKDGEKPTVGGVLHAWRKDILKTHEANRRLRLVGLAVAERALAPGAPKRRFLAVPNEVAMGPAQLLFRSKFRKGGWANALKQAPDEVVRRAAGMNIVSINGISARCQMIDLEAFDMWQAAQGLSARQGQDEEE